MASGDDRGGQASGMDAESIPFGPGACAFTLLAKPVVFATRWPGTPTSHCEFKHGHGSSGEQSLIWIAQSRATPVGLEISSGHTATFKQAHLSGTFVIHRRDSEHSTHLVEGLFPA